MFPYFPKSSSQSYFLELSKSEGIAWDDGKLKLASYDTTQGFGLRAIMGETRVYAHSGSLNTNSLKKAAETVKAITTGRNVNFSVHPAKKSLPLMTDHPVPVILGHVVFSQQGFTDCFFRSGSCSSRL